MIRYPRGVWRPLGRQSEPAMTAHDVICAHTMVNSLKGTDRYFGETNGLGYDGTEAHYGVGGAWGADVAAELDGVVWQWQDRGHQADANGEGNPRVISIETADNAPKSAADIRPWTPKQLAALVDLVAWECSPAAHADCPAAWACHRGVVWRGVRVAIPPVLIADTKPSRRGLAVHRQGVEHSRGVGVDGWLQPGGERWSTSRGKECPGNIRIRQWSDDVIPTVQARLLAAARPDLLEELMVDPAERVALVNDIRDAVLYTPITLGAAAKAQLKTDRASLAQLVQWAAASASDAVEDLADGVRLEEPTAPPAGT